MNNDTIQWRATVVTAVAMIAASASVGAMYNGWSWLPTAVAAIVVVAGAGLLGRALRIPSLLQPILSAGFLVVWATLRFASSDAYGHLIPNSAAWRTLVQQYRFGLYDLTTGSIPVEATTSTLIVLTAGIGLMALAADLLAVGAQRPALAGLPILTILVIGAGVRHGGIGLLPFLLTAFGYLALLSLDARDRTARWGRILTSRTPSHDETDAVASGSGAVWRIGAATLGLALVLPLAIPGATHSRIGGTGGIGSGSSSTTVVDPLSSIQSLLRDESTHNLLRVVTSQASYLRLTALDTFSSNGFSLTPLSAGEDDKLSKGRLDQVQAPRATVPITETITSDNRLADKFLPVPENPTSVSVSGDWRLADRTGTIFSTRTTTSGKTWTAVGEIPQPTAVQLRAEGRPSPRSYSADFRGANLQVPPDLPDVVRTTALNWIQAAGATTTYDIANALQSRFTSADFTYDLNVNIPAGPQGFIDFLRTRRGYCQQYATTMAAMLRSLGIPARVAIGFTPGTKQADGTYLITNTDAHAWPEVWFNDYGWVRFEPTPLITGALIPSYTDGSAGTTGGTTDDPSTPGTSASASASPSTSASASASNDAAALGNNSGGGGGSGSAGVLAWVAVGLVAAFAFAAIPWGARWNRRRVRWRDAAEARPELRAVRLAEAAWTNVIEDAADRGVAIPRSASPRRAGQVLRTALQASVLTADPTASPRPVDTEADAAIDTLVTAVERARYGGANDAPVADPADLRAASELLSSRLGQTVPNPARLGTTLFPPSGRRYWVAPVRNAGQWVARTIDASIAQGEEFMRRLRPHRGPHRGPHRAGGH
jgi:transglutaminase-like putative cysteine protease